MTCCGGVGMICSVAEIESETLVFEKFTVGTHKSSSINIRREQAVIDIV